MLLGFLLVVTSVPQNSVTMDEPVHALTGYSILKTGDLRLVEDHPPLLELLMGYPLSLDKQLPQTESLAGWDLRERRTFGNDAAWMHPPIDRWLFPARIPITFFLVLLTAVVFRWTADIAGLPAGLLCAALIAFDPNIIAHAGLATLDVGVTTLCFSALFLLNRVLKNASVWRILCAGVVLGLALASKVSALPLLPIAGIWMLIRIYRGGWLKKAGLILSVVYFSSAILIVWTTQLFQVGKSPQFPWLIPAPTFWDSIWRISQHMVSENRFSYLLGSIYRGGVWTFFPATFLLKTPANVLFLLCFTALFIRSTWRTQKCNLIFLIIYPLIYLTVSLTGALNLGYRHLLPILPFIYMLLGISVSSTVKGKWLHYFYFYAVIWQIGTAVISWPDYIPYFNLFAGGTSKGYQYLADSNVDWGQGLKAVNKYLVDNEIEQPYISAFTPFVDPTYSYGLQATLLPPQRGESVPLVLPQRYNPEPGEYIISASNLRGLQVADPDMYNWFWHRQHQAVIAGSMLHYHVPQLTNGRSWVAMCSKPVNPLTDLQISERFGIDNIRVVTFDCTQSWIYPSGDPSKGWYVLHNDVLQNNEFIDNMLENSNPQYIQETPRDTPTHSVYTIDEPIYSPSELPNLSTAPGDWNIRKAVSEGTGVSLPVKYGDIFSLTGAEVQMNDEFLELWTKWIVNKRVELPVSLMAHVINRENEVMAVGDGFGLPYTMLQPNDIFVQKHMLDIKIEDPSQVYIQTGVYRLDTMERYPVQDDAMILGDRIIIPIYDIVR